MKKLTRVIVVCLTLISSHLIAADQVEVKFYGFETSPADSQNTASVRFNNFSVEYATTIVPLLFEGDLASNEIAVYFNGSLLDVYSDLADIHNATSQFLVDTTYVQGQQADLEFRLTNNGNQPSLLAFPHDVENISVLEQQVSFGSHKDNASEGKSSGGSAPLAFICFCLVVCLCRNILAGTWLKSG
ncbi:hypothetical protein DS2_15774 [Catenovulum agarivorans DS-2]|uniref:Uncharacterized protein n=2 Tax=Catenovulum agarivorans TaxID=1172192 RepID=W7Q7L7_9ALTE|nr:hypothetical protein DS2_15774 [Catenovulum agarivorans DS-2]